MNGWQALTHMTDQIGQGMNQLVAGLGTVLSTVGQVVQHLYMVLVRQQIILGIQQFLWGLIWWAVALTVVLIIRHINHKRSWAKLDKYVVMAILVIVLYISVTNGAKNLIGSLPQLLNPEYYAIQDGARIYGELKR